MFIILTLFLGCNNSPSIIGSVNNEKLKNGIYDGSYMQFPNRVVVKVTIKDNRIIDVNIVSHFEGKGGKAELPTIKNIIENQSTNVDAVTGATNSSKTIMYAVQRAIEKAYVE